MVVDGRRDRLAWVFLLGGLGLCLGIALSVPLLTRYYIQSASRELEVAVQANQGTVGIQEEDGSTTGALFFGELPRSISSGGSVLTNATDTALLIVTVPDREDVLARIQVYGNSNLDIVEASTPRFTASDSKSILNLRLNSGRVRITVPSLVDYPTSIAIEVPQGVIRTDETGLYSIESSNIESQLAVLQGVASTEAKEQVLELTSDQRVVLESSGSLVGPVATERRLLKNGNFDDRLSEWVELSTSIEIADQPTVEMTFDQSAGENRVRFRRIGIGHADAGLRQIINADITDYDSLRFNISMRILEQSLGVCGQRGSECPIIIRIEYEDVNGIVQTWQQGFFAVGTIAAETPDVCVACPPPLNIHQRVPDGQIVFYESVNLVERLNALGIPPRMINSVNIIASGHSFDVEIIDIDLVAEE